MSDKKFYVYAYNREDGTPYYIGKGTGKRAWRKHTPINLPKDKNRIIILRDNLDEQSAFLLEIELIQKYGRKDIGTGILHNRCDGGQGNSGYSQSDEARKKISVAHQGRHHTEQSKQNMSTGQKGKTFSEEAKLNMSIASKGKKKSREHSEKVRLSNIGKTRTPEQRAKCAAFGMLGKTHTEETKAKIRQSQLGFKHPIKVCPHCGISGAGGNMTRYHFNNCKKRIKTSSEEEII